MAFCSYLYYKNDMAEYCQVLTEYRIFCFAMQQSQINYTSINQAFSPDKKEEKLHAVKVALFSVTLFSAIWNLQRMMYSCTGKRVLTLIFICDRRVSITWPLRKSTKLYGLFLLSCCPPLQTWICRHSNMDKICRTMYRENWSSACTNF